MNTNVNATKWTDLLRGSCPSHFNFKVTSNFTHCAFDNKQEVLLAIDINGYSYFVDLSHEWFSYKENGFLGLSTFLSFNPVNRNEVIMGLTSASIKVVEVNNICNYYLLSGHSSPATNISFYKNEYFLTSSNHEVLVWLLKSCTKIHQLKLNIKDVPFRKAEFSNAGTLSVLYQNDILQCWRFERLKDKEHTIDVNNYGLKNSRDFQFTKDGRTLIICGVQNKILIFSTTNWILLKDIEINESFSGGKKIAVISTAFDGGANSIVAILTPDCKLKYISLLNEKFIDTCCNFQQVSIFKRIVSSANGKFFACIGRHGGLVITILDRIFNVSPEPKVTKVKFNNKFEEKIKERLQCIQQSLKQELRLDRLLPILKEFGEYPEKHRSVIWSTITQLPNNKKSYIALSEKVPFKKSEAVKDYLNFACKGRNFLLEHLINCLLHWCPPIEECLYIQKLVLPFFTVFPKDPVRGFEISIFALINFCHHWFEYHPLPPLNILGIIENVIWQADPKLFNVLCERGITATDYAWPLLQTSMNHVLSPNDWLILWDNLFSIQKPWFLLLCTAAYSLINREYIICKLKCKTDLQKFYRSLGHTNVKDIIQCAHKLDKETPSRIHPKRYLPSEMKFLPKTGSYPPFLQDEFPSFILNEIQINYLKNMREKEQKLREYRLNTLELLEKKKIQFERRNFLKQVEDLRLEELQKCNLEQLRHEKEMSKYKTLDIEEELIKHDLHPDSFWKERYEVKDLRNTADADLKKTVKTEHLEQKNLKKQFETLEYEVLKLLANLKTRSARTEDNNSN